MLHGHCLQACIQEVPQEGPQGWACGYWTSHLPEGEKGLPKNVARMQGTGSHSGNGQSTHEAEVLCEVLEPSILTTRRVLSASVRKAGFVPRGHSQLRVPMLVGPTNSGKSTLALPFRNLFGFSHVFHKPALHSSFAHMRNLLNDKRFIFWDDFRPVEYGVKTVPVATFLSQFQGQPFEAQMSQSFHDGNVDFEWHRGCVMTAKAAALWNPMDGVDAEDIRHMKSRLLVFHFSATVQHIRDTVPCPTCMCRWITEGAQEFDAAPLLAQPLPPSPTHEGLVAGLADLAQKASLPEAKAHSLSQEILHLGAVHVQELLVHD